jgi:hypothetical protein
MLARTAHEQVEHASVRHAANAGRSEVSIEQVRRAVKEFLMNDGSRPEPFEWKVWLDGDH